MAVLQPSHKDCYGSFLVHGPYSVLVVYRILCILLHIQAYPLFLGKILDKVDHY